MRNIRLALLSLMLIAVFLGSYNAARATTPGEPSELFLKNSKAACAVRFDLPNNISLRERKREVLSFINVMYYETSGWNSLLAVAAIDFKDFHHFTLVYYYGCDLPGNVSDALLRVFGKSLKASIENKSHVFSSVEALLKYKNSASLFHDQVPNTPIRTCLVALNAPSIDRGTEVYLETQALWKKYRLPFVDVSWKNDKIYMLLRRNCDAKRYLIDLLFELSDSSGLPLRQLVLNVDVEPNEHEYLATLPQ